jgi:hypothetical protein
MVNERVETWSGRSDDIELPLLGAEFWKEGTVVSGTFDGVREQKIGGLAYKIILDAPLVLDGSEETEVEVPSLTRFAYAVQSLKEKGYQGRRGDLWSIRCYHVKVTTKEGFSNSPEFQIDVIRRNAAAA